MRIPLLFIFIIFEFYETDATRFVPTFNESFPIPGQLYDQHLLSSGTLLRSLLTTSEISNAVEEDFIYTTPGEYIFTVPATCPMISVLLIGAGGGGANSNNDGGGGGGGGLLWVNDIVTIASENFIVNVGAGGAMGKIGKSSSLIANNVSLIAEGGLFGYDSSGGPGGRKTISILRQYGATGGGQGGHGGNGNFNYDLGNANAGGGGGAAGYTGMGGEGGRAWSKSVSENTDGQNGSGGGGGGGDDGGYYAGGGGGVGIFGQGANGAGGVGGDLAGPGGGGGSLGTSGTAGFVGSATTPGGAGNGGEYGGGGGGRDATTYNAGSGGGGAVRIMCTSSRSYPYLATTVPLSSR